MRDVDKSRIFKTLLRAHGVTVISVSEPFDANQPIDKLMETLLEALGEFYSANLAMETKKGQSQNAKQGWHNGGVALYGYKLTTVTDERGSTHRTFSLAAPEKVQVVRNIYDWYLTEDIGIAKIAQRLNEQGISSPAGKSAKGWSPSVIHRMLRNPSYAGSRTWNQQPRYGGGSWNPREEWIVQPNSHPAIISQEDFDKVQQIAESRLKAQQARRVENAEQNLGGKPIYEKKTDRTVYSLSGLVKCGECGSNYIGNTAHRYRTNGTKATYRRYLCNGHIRKICSTGYLTAAILEGSKVDPKNRSNFAIDIRGTVTKNP